MFTLALCVAICGFIGGAMLLIISPRLKIPSECHQCGYDLRGSYFSRRCPECGASYAQQNIHHDQPHREPRLWMDWLGVVMLSMGLLALLLICAIAKL
jgi:hypothetical protein